ncbi:electron transfer flavoprotein subunit beta/FixA family protein [Paenibacillus sp. J5C_2022]|uniref:electron transfer flavoprotein subunit beta/FixA family protein n=1 Tax=Paenibacillus sp. J5C2022 TaxID=2977129 RepID=UPI0021D179D3|nr:electron transfer flavoprotein subunit beta/FixA family protein [Paenibacillus sp. J5C2022]MCU6710625.1 electron transfer flavoprotein subunit beta/FixA family protein [Paenibacillus sp. J5C2022]
MKIVVLLKQTFDTEEKIKIIDGAVDERDAKYVINPYDEYALEEAIRLKEKHGGEVIVAGCGPDRAKEALRTALAIGADEAILLDDESLTDDSSQLAAALAAVIAPLSPELVLAGLFAVDTGSGSVALQVAQHLDLPHASAALKLTIDSGEQLGAAHVPGAARYALVDRDVEGDMETVCIPLPALITAQQGLNEPRYPSLPGIMKAKRKPLRVVTLADLTISADGAEARTARTELTPPPQRAAGKRLGGTAEEQTRELVLLLQTEAKLL